MMVKFRGVYSMYVDIQITLGAFILNRHLVNSFLKKSGWPDTDELTFSGGH